MKPDELTQEDHQDSYKAVASEFGYDTVGVPATEADNLNFDEYRASGYLGKLHQLLWEQEITWVKPEKESAKCWFIVNAASEVPLIYIASFRIQVQIIHHCCGAVAMHILSHRMHACCTW